MWPFTRKPTRGELLELEHQKQIDAVKKDFNIGMERLRRKTPYYWFTKFYENEILEDALKELLDNKIKNDV